MNSEYRRWYEHDPLLLEVVEILKNYQNELRAQAEVFLKKIEAKDLPFRAKSIRIYHAFMVC